MEMRKFSVLYQQTNLINKDKAHIGSLQRGVDRIRCLCPLLSQLVNPGW